MERGALHAAVRTCRFVREQEEWGLSVYTLQAEADHDAKTVKVGRVRPKDSMVD